MDRINLNKRILDVIGNLQSELDPFAWDHIKNDIKSLIKDYPNDQHLGSLFREVLTKL